MGFLINEFHVDAGSNWSCKKLISTLPHHLVPFNWPVELILPYFHGVTILK
jgi:hypothetical protein